VYPGCGYNKNEATLPNVRRLIEVRRRTRIEAALETPRRNVPERKDIIMRVAKEDVPVRIDVPGAPPGNSATLAT
jgi:hypothetical protein